MPPRKAYTPASAKIYIADAALEPVRGAIVFFFLTLRAVHVILNLKERGHFEKNWRFLVRNQRLLEKRKNRLCTFPPLSLFSSTVTSP